MNKRTLLKEALDKTKEQIFEVCDQMHNDPQITSYYLEGDSSGYETGTEYFAHLFLIHEGLQKMLCSLEPERRRK